MAVQRIKIWLWVVISLFVGIGVGFVWVELQSDLEGPGSLQATNFFRSLRAKTDKGEPLVRDIVIDPVRVGPMKENIQRVRFNIMMLNRQTKQYDPVPHDTIANVPYIRLGSQKDPQYEGYFQALAARNPAVPAADNRIADYLDYLKTQGSTLSYSRSLTQVSPVEAVLTDEKPDPGFLTRMVYAARRGLPVDRELHWWQKRTYAWALSIGASVLLVGVLWPMAIRMMVKMGLGLPEEEGVDLSKVASNPTVPSFARAAPSAEDQQDLDDLNAQLEANVSGMLVTSNAADEEQERRAEAAVIKKLEATRLESQEGVAAPEKPKDYAGEFYPVAKPRTDGK